MDTKKKPKFLRRKNQAYSKLGKRRKKKQVWRRPTGRDNKMREKRKGFPAVVSIGYRTDRISRWAIKNKQPVYIHNVNDLKKIKEDGIAIIGNVGKKKKLEIAKAAKEKKVEIFNMNPEKYLKKNEKKKEEKKDSKESKSDKKSKVQEDKK
jgi:large subunit ribosomal protein L32e